MRHFVLAATLAATLCPSARSSAALRSGIIPETTARRHGLTRPWFTQVQLDRARARVGHIVLYEGILYVQSDHAMVHAIDAETGETIWAKQIGRPNHPSMTPGAGRDLLAIVNGSRLYVCNRFDGEVLYEVQVDGAPAAGPALSEKRAYVPMINGMVMAYRLEPPSDPLAARDMAELDKVEENLTDEETAAAEQDQREHPRFRQEHIPPLACRSLGRAPVQPLVTQETEDEEFVVWPTDLGYLNIGVIDRRREDVFAVKYRLKTDAGIAARPTYLPPDPNIVADSGIIFGASRDGFVHAIREKNGHSLWRFSTGEPILEPAVVIGQEVYVATQPGGMYCLNAKTGSEQWWAPYIKQFLAASRQRVYAADKLGRIRVLDAKTGARLDTMAADGLPVKLTNSWTDRLYLATDTGLLQCLHEVELSDPIRHHPTPKEAPEQEATGQGEPAAEEPQAGQPTAEELPAQQPADQENPSAGDDDNPFN